MGADKVIMRHSKQINKGEIMIQFETGKRYFGRSIGDYDCIYTMTVISRTAKTIKVKMQNWIDVKTLRPSVYEGSEQVKPFGTYSMCPVISATKVIQ